jgi:hypothetical protein
MSAGRPRKVDPGSLYAFAHQFYWDFRRIAEGGTRRRLDKAMYEALVARINEMEIQITKEERSNIESIANREIESGRLKKADKRSFIRNAEDSQVIVNRDWMCRRAAETATKELSIPGESEIIAELLEANTPRQIRKICADSQSQITFTISTGEIKKINVPNWPLPEGSVLPSYLSQYASEFIAAKSDPRFPKSAIRPSSRLRQLWFLSRALAGALYGIKTRTAINLVGSKRPEIVFDESRSDGRLQKTKRGLTKS